MVTVFMNDLATTLQMWLARDGRVTVEGVLERVAENIGRLGLQIRERWPGLRVVVHPMLQMDEEDFGITRAYNRIVERAMPDGVAFLNAHALSKDLMTFSRTPGERKERAETYIEAVRAFFVKLAKEMA